MMSFRKIIVVAFIISVIIPNIMTAQREVKKFNSCVSTSPISLAFDVWPIVTYEMQIAKENTITAQLRYTSLSDWSAWGIGASYRWYLFQEKEKALKGFSFGPLIRLEQFSHKSEKADKSDESLTLFSIGAEGSYKFIFDGGFVVEPNLQLGFGVNNSGTVYELKYPWIGIGINVGYAWK